MQQQGGCPHCGVANVAAARFCMACGALLVRRCSSCGAEAQLQARFCIACGSTLDLGGNAAMRGANLALNEERRTVTVLFADLVGYTSVAEQLDHETFKALTDRCLTRFAIEVERFGGYVDQYIGDNVMAVFGAPVAHEHDAEHAVRAAWGMQTAMAELNQGIAPEFGFELALRIGINTGEVLAGRIGEEYTVVGDTVNVAARLQAAARVGGILVGERTQRSSALAVLFRELGPLRLKGKAAPVSAWEVVRLREPDHLPERYTPRTQLVGRRAELSQLLAAFEHVARDRTSHLVTILGEAGVGKTRLLHELERRLKRRVPPMRILRGRCLMFGSGIVYWPLSEMLRAECGILAGDSGSRVRAKLAERLGPSWVSDEGSEQIKHRLALLARLLGVEPAEEDEPPSNQADQQSAREALFGAVRAVLEALAQEGMLAIVWEDIHWADEGTLDLIEYLAQWLRAPVLQVCLARDELLERRPNFCTLPRSATSIFLEPLTQPEARELIEALVQRTGVAVESAARLAERSSGNPLFAEALVERIAEGGSEASAELPDTVQRLLAARLDSLEPLERQLVAHAAVLGPTFWASALEPIAASAGMDLTLGLAALGEKNLIVLSESDQQAGEREFSFKHALIRDVAYEMLPKAVRARKHAEVGAFIEQRAGERGEGIVALLAEHYARAATLAADVHLPAAELSRLRRKALECGEAAGDAAAALFSNREALAQYQAVAVFAEPGGPAALRIADKSGDAALRLGRVEPAIQAWQRCLAHFRQQNDLPRVADMHRKIGAALSQQGERKAAIEQLQLGINLIMSRPASLGLVRLYEEAASLYMQVGANMLAIYAAEKALHLAEDLGEARAASRAHGIFGRVFGRIGDTANARENLERAVELARDSDVDEIVLALLALGQYLEHSEGNYGNARDCYLEALALAERIGDAPAQIELRSALAQLAFYRCDWEEAQRASDAAAELAEREGLVGKLCLSNTLRGQLRWRDGDWSTSERLFRSAPELAERAGWSEVSFSALTGLAVTLRDRGDLDAAESALARALAVCERAGLIPQSLQAYASLALTRVLAGRTTPAREAAMQAATLGQRVHDPVGEAAVLEARGIVGELPGSLDTLRQAHAAWERLGRRLDVARCELLLGRRLRDYDLGASNEVLAGAAKDYEELGVRHLAEQSRELVGI
jgi:predicted ATPase/class 3 adenylate cyclase